MVKKRKTSIIRTRQALRTILCAAVAAAVMAVSAITAFADGSADISAPQSVGEGEEFTVTVTFTASVNIGSVKASIDYDSDVIEFVSGDFVNGGGGLCNINAWSETAGSTQTYYLKFKALKQGSSQLMITNSSVLSDIGDLIGSPLAVSSVTVGEIKQPLPPLTEATQTEPQTTSAETSPQEETSHTTAATTDDYIQEQPEETSPEDDAQLPQEESAVSSSGDSGADGKDDKGAVTAILLVGGGVAVVCLAMTGGVPGKRRGRRR